MKFDFVLSRQEKVLGKIQFEEGSGKITGDASAVAALETAVHKAITARHISRYPPPGLVIIDKAPAYSRELISVLEFGGFDIPEALAYDTADAEYERTEAALALIKEHDPEAEVYF